MVLRGMEPLACSCTFRSFAIDSINWHWHSMHWHSVHSLPGCCSDWHCCSRSCWRCCCCCNCNCCCHSGCNYCFGGNCCFCIDRDCISVVAHCRDTILRADYSYNCSVDRNYVHSCCCFRVLRCSTVTATDCRHSFCILHDLVRLFLVVVLCCGDAEHSYYDNAIVVASRYCCCYNSCNCCCRSCLDVHWVHPAAGLDHAGVDVAVDVAVGGVDVDAAADDDDGFRPWALVPS
mmetsp:Transcript_53091/g.84680  ORF Transcript_53091/g.84680 Transcript_53091/m.84680 type:complete len:233 (+) Transcript_53091:1342-2040(+)